MNEGTELTDEIKTQDFVGENGEIISFRIDKREWSIYVLLYNGLPIYAGQTTNINARISQHKYAGRKFDSYLIVNTVYTAPAANAAEQTILKYLHTMNPTMENKKSNKGCSGIIRI